MIMERLEDKNRLDEALTEAIGSEGKKPDFEKWKQTHMQAVEMLTSRAGMGPTSTRPLNIGRIIMKSPITKLAAAAMLIFAAVLSITILDKSATHAYAVTDLPGLFEQAKIIHIQGWQYFGGHRMPDGKKIRPVEIDNWVDLENSRSRHTGTGVSIDKNGVRVTIGETISDGQYQVNLDHTEKDVTFFKVSDYQRMLNAYLISKLMYGQMFSEIEQLKNFKKVGWEQIDEIVYDIWQREVIHAVTEHTNRFKYWISPNSGKLGRVQMWSKANNDQWELNYDYCEIDYDVEVPDGIFAMEIPEGYTLKNTMKTAIPEELGSGGGVGYGDDQCSLRADTKIGFIMGDGSVIVAWGSENSKSDTLQDELFKGLEFGGPLPKLPVEIYGLKPAGVSSDTTYTGYHLTYTQKAGKFVEWSLYVPDGTPPASVREFGYDVLYRFNLDHEPKWRIGLTVNCMPIEAVEDFDKWVLGAMAELSDDGKAPENVTYENILQLTEQIRE
jgi:outer membrane lipoprotein-sorting protein